MATKNNSYHPKIKSEKPSSCPINRSTSPPTDAISIICDRLKNFKNTTCSNQRKVVKHMMEHINTHNQTLIFDPCSLFVSNTGPHKNEFESYIIGFDGNILKASAMLDTCCSVNGIIGPNIVTTANIAVNKYGCSYIFLIKKLDRIFIGASISDPTHDVTLSMVKDNGSGFATDYCGDGVDFVISYSNLVKMGKIGWFPSIAEQMNQNTIMIPFNHFSGLRTYINDVELISYINTGTISETDHNLLLNIDLYIGYKWLQKNHTRAEIIVHIDFEYIYGKIRELIICHWGQKFVLRNLEFISTVYSILDRNKNIEFDCILTRSTIKKLEEQNVIPMMLY